MARKRKKKPLTWSMMGMLVLGWLLPVMLVALCMLYIVSSMLSRQIERTITSSTDKAAEICEMKLAEILAASRNATYSNTIRDSYYQYKHNSDAQKLYADITYYLNQQYKYDPNMPCTMVFLVQDPKQIYYTYNTYHKKNRGNEGYAQVLYFKENVLDDVIAASEEMGTGAKLLYSEEHLYMARNLVDASFHPYAMIVIELAVPDIFNAMDSVWGSKSYQVFLEGTPVLETEFPKDHVLPREDMADSIYVSQKENNYSYREMTFGSQKLVYAVQVSKEIALDELNMIRYVIGMVGIFLIPLMIMIFYFFNRKVSRPMRDLVKAAKEISEGNYGHQITTKAASREFDYLEQSFNSMSLELQHQFEKIYKEELALKDASIMALQSQINPHFLNNTLEIINWEARMCGADSVSGMIEALGTMLSATMNRKQRRFVTLAEELSYVDAYLYIISKRFGGRFKVSREIDSSLLQLEVPMLIIQPIVENAVEHGVEENKEGMVGLKIYADWDKIIIEVKNDGTLSESDRERIDFLLNGEEKDENVRHVSLGIRNVSRRLKIIYGEECGLTIESDKQQHTVSRLVVKMLHENSTVI